MANGFTVKNMPATLSGYMAHVYCEDTDQVNIAWNSVKVECDAFGWGAKVADAGFFEAIRPGHKQWGKGVTIYFPTKVEWAPGGPRPMMRSDDGGGWTGASPNGTKTVMASKTGTRMWRSINGIDSVPETAEQAIAADLEDWDGVGRWWGTRSDAEFYSGQGALVLSADIPDEAFTESMHETGGLVRRDTPLVIDEVYWLSDYVEDGGEFIRLRQSGPIHVKAALDNEARISVAEQVMERAGLAGDVILVPDGRMDDPAYQAAIAPLVQWVSDLCRQQIRFYASDYILNTDGGGAQALTDGMNKIVVRPITNTMTILHEVAHVLNRSSEGRGHDDQFITTLEGLYRKHLGNEAADTFIDLARPAERY